MLRRLFTEHPSSVQETYWEHLAMAGSFGFRLLLAALACSVHALLPFLFVKTGSRMIAALHDTMVTNRARKRAQSGPARARVGAALQAAE